MQVKQKESLKRRRSSWIARVVGVQSQMNCWKQYRHHQLSTVDVFKTWLLAIADFTELKLQTSSFAIWASDSTILATRSYRSLFNNLLLLMSVFAASSWVVGHFVGWLMTLVLTTVATTAPTVIGGSS